MIAQVLALRAGPLSKELADTVRRVNAQHIELANGRVINDATQGRNLGRQRLSLIQDELTDFSLGRHGVTVLVLL